MTLRETRVIDWLDMKIPAATITYGLYKPVFSPSLTWYDRSIASCRAVMRLLDFCANDLLIHTMSPIAAGSNPPVLTRRTLKRPEVRVITEQITMRELPWVIRCFFSPLYIEGNLGLQVSLARHVKENRVKGDHHQTFVRWRTTKRLCRRKIHLNLRGNDIANLPFVVGIIDAIK